jgi:hypothetical protein
VHVLSCSGLTSVCGFCVPTLSRAAKDAARAAPQGPPEHTRTAGAAARRRQRAHTVRGRPQIGAPARVQRVQGEREERPDLTTDTARGARGGSRSRELGDAARGGRQEGGEDGKGGSVRLAGAVSQHSLRGSATTHRRVDRRRADARALALGERELGVHAQREQRRGRERLDELARGRRRDGRGAGILKSESGRRRRRGPRRGARSRRGGGGDDREECRY